MVASQIPEQVPARTPHPLPQYTTGHDIHCHQVMSLGGKKKEKNLVRRATKNIRKAKGKRPRRRTKNLKNEGRKKKRTKRGAKPNIKVTAQWQKPTRTPGTYETTHKYVGAIQEMVTVLFFNRETQR